MTPLHVTMQGESKGDAMPNQKGAHHLFLLNNAPNTMSIPAEGQLGLFKTMLHINIAMVAVVHQLSPSSTQ